MPTLKTTEGFVIETYPPPPAGFDLGAATDSERSLYGFSAFSNDRALESKWQAQLKGYQFIAPQFSPRPVKPKLIAPLTSDALPHRTPTWSGAIIPAPPADPVRWVEGSWTVPSLALPPDAPDGRVYAASPWIGIDGDGGSPDILQAGCDGEVTLSGGTAKSRFRLWYEWYPGSSNYVTNIPIAPGDVLAAVIKLAPGSVADATVLLTNQSRRLAAPFTVRAKQGFPLVGNCAEWIVECNPQLGALGNFGIVNFGGCRAGTASGATAGVANAIPVVMVDAYNRVLSNGTVAGPDSVRVNYVQT
jgi:Peptidase A4 family